MHSISASEALTRLGRLIEKAAHSNAPLRIIGKRKMPYAYPNSNGNRWLKRWRCSRCRDVRIDSRGHDHSHGILLG